MATSYTSNKKIGALDSASTPLAATNEIVINQNGDILKTPLSAVEAKVFDAKTQTTTPTGTEVTIVRQTDGSLRQVPLANIVPALNITNAQISNSAAIVDTKLDTINTAGKVTNQAVQATPAISGGAYSNALGANKIVTRDGSGNFAAGTVTATLSGNASTATTLQTGRTIALTGDVTYTSPSFDGSANVTAASTIANNAVTTAKIADANVTTAKIADANVTTAKIADSAVTSAKIADNTIVNADINSSAGIVDTKLATISTAGKVSNSATTATSANTASAIVARDGSGNFSAGTVTAALTGNASTATTLATGRTIALTGDVTGTTGSFNGSANVSAATTIANNAVTTAKIANNAIDNTKIRDSAALSVIGRSANSTGDPADIAAGTDGHVLRRSGTGLGFGQVGSAGIATGAVTATELATNAVTTIKISNNAVDNTKIRDSAGLSVIGRSVNSSGDPGDIVAGSDGQVFQRSGSSLGFGTIATAGITNSAITLEKLASAVQQRLVPVGSVIALAHGTIPSGWVLCNGAEYAKTGTYAALFAVLQTYYGETNGSGGAGTSHFRVPDLRGVFIRGSETQVFNGISYAAGTFGRIQQDAFQGHRHAVSHNAVTGPGLNGSGGSPPFILGGATITILDAVTDGGNGTPRAAFETRPVNMPLNYIIKF